MWQLPTALRAKIALVVLLGAFLIPVTTSSLRGLTHVLTCSEKIDATLSVDSTADDDPAVLLSADAITGDEEDPGLCGGLIVDLQLASTDDDSADVELSVENTTDVDWQGSIELAFSGIEVPIAIGEIGAGETVTDMVTLSIEPGRTYEIEGTLLLGP